MFIAIDTRTMIPTAHATAVDAVDHLLHGLGGDYDDQFWASEDGSEIRRGNRMVDFDLYVYPSVEDAIEAQRHLDDDVREEVIEAIRAVA